MRLTAETCSQVLAWQTAEPLDAQRVIASLDGFNAQVSASFDALHALLAPHSGSDYALHESARLAMAQRTSEQVRHVCC